MQTVALSEMAVAVLRLRVRGHKLPVTEHRQPAYQELAKAGIMEPDGEEFRFTEDGWARRDQILEAEQDRIERERYAPPDCKTVEKGQEIAAGVRRRRHPHRESVGIAPHFVNWSRRGS